MLHSKVFSPVILLVFLIGLTACNKEQTQASTSKINVMTFNIRYDNPDDGINRWDNRKQRVRSLIQFYAPAVFGIQEGLLHQVKYLDDNLTSYKWIGVGRQDGTMSGEFSAVFYDTTKVKLIPGSHKTFWLSETPSKPSKSWNAALPRIVTRGRFRLRSGNQEFFVFNTHFDHIGDTARVQSAKLIRRKISELKSPKPVILMGDFNATPTSEPYSVLTSGKNGLQNAYNISKVPHVGPLFTYEGFSVLNGSEKRRIDYIFVNEKVTVHSHAVISSFRDGRYPSDHLPVVANIEIGQ